ncbi:DUF4373 domain-containing protein [uncultured Rikenella sp.]|uniref:DUF4373 domain-containing protein n=1 Tax=uncultured Rikenella sp. TaxID=368003 RepID=UPI00272DA9BF|nr:DUF4373 domain-containing protein [uncultured Rikenella sp.]
MNKDAYYFPHDSNAKDDPKCVLLIEQLGMEGYGIYWMLIETLRDQPGYRYPVALLPALARRYNTTVEKVKTVVYNYDLFIVEGDEIFFSQSLIDRMIPLEHKREQARKAGLKSAEKRALINCGSTTVERPFNDRSTSKVKESKVNKKERRDLQERRFTPPALEEVQRYVSEKGYRIDAQRFIDYYASNGWKVGKNPMRDWKATVRNWQRRENTQSPIAESQKGEIQPKFFKFAQ